MVFKYICVLVLWTRLASSFRAHSFVVIKQYNAFNTYWSQEKKCFHMLLTYCVLAFLLDLAVSRTGRLSISHPPTLCAGWLLGKLLPLAFQPCNSNRFKGVPHGTIPVVVCCRHDGGQVEVGRATLKGLC